MADEYINEIFENVDKDGNSKIDFREFSQAAFDARILLKDDNLKKTFVAFDVDGDGGID